jgi:hypothetical protein
MDMPNKTRTYSVELTLNELVAVRDLVKEAHANADYYAGKNLAETEASSERWLVTSIKEARAKQAAMSALHEAITGEPLEATTEAAPTPADADA